MEKKCVNKYEIDMCNGPILKKMLSFAIPLMCTRILQLLFNAVDVIVLGKFAGDHSMAAVGSTASIITLLVNFFTGLSIGVNVLVSRYWAARREKQVKETIHTAIVLAGICGIILMIIGIIIMPTILRWMDTPEEIFDLAVLYTRIYFIGVPAILLYNFGAAIMRSVGDTKRPMSYLIVAGITNALLNLFFVIVLHGDVWGVGLATAISQMLSAALILRSLMKEKSMIRLEIRQLHFYKDKFWGILEIGLPAGIQSALFNVANVMVQSSVNLFGATVVAGSSAASNIGDFVYVSMDSYQQASLTFTSQNVGAGKYKRVNRVLFTALGGVTVTGLIVGVGSYLMGPQLLSLYTNSDKVIAAGMIYLSIVATTYVLCGIMNVLVGAMRGMGHPVLPVIVTLLGSCVFRIVWLQTVFKIEQFHKIEMVYVVYPISWVLTITAHAVTYIVIYRKFSKRQNEMEEN